MLQRTLIIIVSLIFVISCKSNSQNSDDLKSDEKTTPDFQISLAQWSLHRSFFGPQKDDYWNWYHKMLQESPDSLIQGELDPMDFPTIAATYGVKSIELANIFYFGKAEDEAYWVSFKQKCEEADVTVGLIMCDALGNLADADAVTRMTAVENHYKWVDVAKFLGAHSIRVNAAGDGSREDVAINAIDGLTKLGKYGASNGINIIVENHGGYSSDGSWLAGVMKEVDMENVGTLPDFGNFCIEGSPKDCTKAYDRYQGITDLMPFAKGVSAKSLEFDEQGNEINSDFDSIMRIVKNSGYKGYIGIEYEGDQLSEDKGIKATKLLLEKVIKKLEESSDG